MWRFIPKHHLKNDIPMDRTPIIQMLSAFQKKEAVSFHMPGHTGGKSFSKWLHRNALSIDTTELDSTDDLNHPGCAVTEAALLAAKAFGAEKTFFVTTGSTTSVYAAFLGVTRPGNEVILFRNVHKSVLNACVMFDLVPVFTTETALSDTLARHPDAVAVFLTRPDYFGRCIDIQTISNLVHASGRILITDEAHGTHFAFCPSLLPVPAISNGADLVVQSAHKTAPSLTQGSFLHLSHEAVACHRIDPSSIQEALTMISTSSPSFLIAATLDFARAFLEESGDAVSRELYESLTCFYSLLDPEWIPCFKHPDEKDSRVVFDPFRLVITIRNMPFTAGETAEELSKQGIYVEFHDLLCLVLICKFENTRADFIRLARILNRFLLKSKASWCKASDAEKEALSNRIRELERLDLRFKQEMQSVPERSYPPHCGLTGSHQAVLIPLKEAAGRTVISAIVPYPPGIPLIWPGEILMERAVFLIEEVFKNGYPIYGIEVLPEKNSGDLLPHIRCILDDSCRN